jgi:hypothetical protein
MENQASSMITGMFSKADYVYADQLENLARYFMNPAS